MALSKILSASPTTFPSLGNPVKSTPAIPVPSPTADSNSLAQEMKSIIPQASVLPAKLTSSAARSSALLALVSTAQTPSFR